MKITVEQQQLRAALGVLSKAVGTSLSMPIIENFLLVAEGNSLQITATDLTLSMQVTIPAQVEESGSLALPARKTAEMVKELSAADVHIASRDLHLEATCENTEWEIAGVDPEDFPTLQPVDADSPSVEMPNVYLKDAIRKTAFVATEEQARYQQTGIQVWAEPGKIEFAATDSRRLAVWTLLNIANITVETKVLIPATRFAQFAHGIGDEGQTTLRFGKTRVELESENVKALISLLTGLFPPYRQLIEREVPNHVTIDRKPFLAAVHRAAVFASEDTRRVVIRLNDGLCSVSANQQTGKGRDEFGLDHGDCDNLELGCSHVFLAAALTAMTPEIEVGYTDGENPMFLRAFDKETDGGELCSCYTHVIMPMQLSEVN